MRNKCLSNEQLQDYLDHNLPAEEQESFCTHLKGCPECQQQLHQFNQVYASAQKYSYGQLSHQATVAQVDSVMNKIRAKTAPKRESNFTEEFFRKLSWILVPALAAFIGLYIFVYSPNTPRSGIAEKGFSLAGNKVELILEQSLPIQMNGKDIHGKEIKDIPLHHQVSLPENTVIMVKADGCRTIFSNNAVFSLSEKEVELSQGKANFSLAGKHEGFAVKTRFARVLPLGTEFSVQANSDFVKIELQSGKIKIVSISGNSKIIDDVGKIFVKKDGRFTESLSQQPPDVPQAQPATTSGSVPDLYGSDN